MDQEGGIFGDTGSDNTELGSVPNAGTTSPSQGIMRDARMFEAVHCRLEASDQRYSNVHSRMPHNDATPPVAAFSICPPCIESRRHYTSRRSTDRY